MTRLALFSVTLVLALATSHAALAACPGTHYPCGQGSCCSK